LPQLLSLRSAVSQIPALHAPRAQTTTCSARSTLLSVRMSTARPSPLCTCKHAICHLPSAIPACRCPAPKDPLVRPLPPPRLPPHPLPIPSQAAPHPPVFPP